MSLHIAGMKITQSGDDVRIALDFNLPPSQWPDEAIDRLMADLTEPEKPSLVDELLDENAELRRDGDMAIERLSETCAKWRTVAIALAVLLVATLARLRGWW